MLSRPLSVLLILLCALPAAAARANVFQLPEDGSAIFGTTETITTRYTDTLIEIARRYSLGYEELTRVNPGVDPWLPGEGTRIVIPGQRLLPVGPREGILVNLPEHRLYYFAEAKRGEPRVVHTFPVSVGKMDWRTPMGRTRIVAKTKDPSWYPPESVRKEHLERGDPLPAVVPPGPDNPLGAYAMRLAIAGGSYLIHGTNNPDAVGMPVTHGCLRMYPEDVEKLFGLVKVGTTVELINQPIKLATVANEVWLEVHPPIDAEGQTVEPVLAVFEQQLDQILGATLAAVHWERAVEVLRQAQGIPAVVGLELAAEPISAAALAEAGAPFPPDLGNWAPAP